MSLEVRGYLDENEKEGKERLSGNQTTASVIKKYRAKYDGIDLPK